MIVGSTEHHEMIAAFDKEYPCLRLDKEERPMWRRGQVYQNGEVNDLFQSFSKGYAFARSVYMQ